MEKFRVFMSVDIEADNLDEAYLTVSAADLVGIDAYQDFKVIGGRIAGDREEVTK